MATKNPLSLGFKEYGLISLGLILYSFGFTALLIPAQTVPGGAGGISSLIYYGMGEPTGWLSVGTIYFFVNGALLALGLLIIGPKFGIKTIYAIVFNSLMMNIFERVLPVGLLGLSAAAGDQLLMVILGGVFCGIGVGVCFSQGGSSGGTDIIAMIVNKYYNISYGKVIMACDLMIIMCSVAVFKGDLKPAIYGFVTLASVGYTIDLFLSGSKQSSQIMIFSPHHKEIAAAIIAQVGRGVSLLNGEGGYTGAPQKVVMVVCRKTEQSLVYHVIKQIDPNAFITVGSVMGVYGKGFDALKVKEKKTGSAS